MHITQSSVPFVPKIPKAFMVHNNIMQILSTTVFEFGYEEQQAIYYHYFLDLPPGVIARVVQLSKKHVVNTLGLYAQRLEVKLDFFKRVQPYDENETVQVRDILFPWSA